MSQVYGEYELLCMTDVETKDGQPQNFKYEINEKDLTCSPEILDAYPTIFKDNEVTKKE